MKTNTNLNIAKKIIEDEELDIINYYNQYENRLNLNYLNDDSYASEIQLLIEGFYNYLNIANYNLNEMGISSQKKYNEIEKEMTNILLEQLKIEIEGIVKYFNDMVEFYNHESNKNLNDEEFEETYHQKYFNAFANELLNVINYENYCDLNYILKNYGYFI